MGSDEIAEQPVIEQVEVLKSESRKPPRPKSAKFIGDKQARYEDSLAKNVPIIVAERGLGRVLFYDRETDLYSVAVESRGEVEVVVEVRPDKVQIDGNRIFSPQTIVETPFGLGQIVGLDPHLGCYAVTNLAYLDDQDSVNPYHAYLQIQDVIQHHEERESHDVIVDSTLPIPDQIVLQLVQIVGHRIINQRGLKYVQYQLKIETTNYGTVYCWKRYSSFREHCDRLLKEAGYKKKDIPVLPRRHLFTNFTSKTINERVTKLNEFLQASVRAKHLQWGIKVNSQISIYLPRTSSNGTSPPPQKWILL